MKMYLILLNMIIWTIAHTCVEFLDEDEELEYEQLQQIHHIAQASSVLVFSLDKDEFDRVNGLEKAKEIWDTLQRCNSLKGNLIDLSCLMMNLVKRCTTG
jgi:predicted translin family RNA/ssDNA-binding protein